MQQPLDKKEENILDQNFTATAPNEKWVADVTAIWTREGWLYVAGVLDLFSRALIGWAMDRVQDEQLVERALLMALHRRHPKEGLLHHSDRGCQYTSGAYPQVLASHGVLVSMSRTGNCYDNAPIESFWATLKRECLMGTPAATRVLARQAIFQYIETYYNRQRRHSSLGYLSPSAYEALLT